MARASALGYSVRMAHKPQKATKSIEEIAAEDGLYPMEAYQFVGMGLGYTTKKIKGDVDAPEPSRHVSGQELAQGLRELALKQWGRLAKAVLARWNIHSTDDFGRIVFRLVENQWMSKTENDRLEDFHKVYDFETAFVEEYQIKTEI
jgi:uncharacterized repeat protein (TIGR04138 family)